MLRPRHSVCATRAAQEVRKRINCKVDFERAAREVLVTDVMRKVAREARVRGPRGAAGRDARMRARLRTAKSKALRALETGKELHKRLVRRDSRYHRLTRHHTRSVGELDPESARLGTGSRSALAVQNLPSISVCDELGAGVACDCSNRFGNRPHPSAHVRPRPLPSSGLTHDVVQQNIGGARLARGHHRTDDGVAR